jgi:hypothetical protein
MKLPINSQSLDIDQVWGRILTHLPPHSSSLSYKLMNCCNCCSQFISLHVCPRWNFQVSLTLSSHSTELQPSTNLTTIYALAETVNCILRCDIKEAVSTSDNKPVINATRTRLKSYNWLYGAQTSLRSWSRSTAVFSLTYHSSQSWTR